MVMAVLADITIDPQRLIESPWVHDKAHELLVARLRAIKALERRFERKPAR